MPSSLHDLVSVVIVDHSDGRTADCVAAVEAADWPRELLDIIVVDASGTEAKRDTFGADVRTLRAKDGLASAANTGAAHARGEFIGFIDGRARPDAGWIREAMSVFRSAGNVGAVMGTVLDGDTPASASISRASAPPRDVIFGDATALFARSHVFSEAEGFDQTLFPQLDAVDFNWRLNLMGYHVRLAPASVVTRVARPVDDADARILHERNALILLYKNLDESNLGRFMAGALALAVQTGDSKGDAATLRGAGDFLTVLPSLRAGRAQIQATRLTRDDTILPLLGDVRSTLGLGTRSVGGAHELIDALGIAASSRRTRILVVTMDLVGKRMAGPAIRAWKMSEHLALRHDVRLVSSNAPKQASTAFSVHHAPDDRTMRDHERWADVIVIQGYALRHYHSLARTEKIMVADIYDPLHLEQLEQARSPHLHSWNAQVITAAEVLNEQIARADFFVCASEKQRTFWLGQLAAAGRVNALTYEADNALDSLIAVVPFGLDDEVPDHTRHAIKGTVPGISADDKVLIWGGGIYDWFDTETLLRAMRKVADSHPDARLFFLGVTHPNPDVPQMKVVSRTFELADELGLTDTHVFFNRGWVSVEDRHNYLLDADAAVSTHYEHIETAFSFRTRILDYLWARLPMVTTKGDGFADLIDAAPLGITVPERDVELLADAIIAVLYDDALRADVEANIDEVRSRFTWARALEPLVTFCAAPYPASDRELLTERHLLGGFDPVAATLRARYRGVRKIARLARHYLRKEGPRGLLHRIRDRVRIF
jgi:glycosyltransferase involved in cell wall biosynthesis/GT2 family glycosyltransferase